MPGRRSLRLYPACRMPGRRSLRHCRAYIVLILAMLLVPATGVAQDATPAPLLPPAPPTDLPAQPVSARTVEPGEDEVVRGDPTRPRISLVVNVGAGSEPAVSMLDTLREKGVKTTFFVLGWWADRKPDILKYQGSNASQHVYSRRPVRRQSDRRNAMSPGCACHDRRGVPGTEHILSAFAFIARSTSA